MRKNEVVPVPRLSTDNEYRIRRGVTSMRGIIRGILLGLFLSVAFDIEAQARTLKAASCSQTDLQNALNSASTGDTIIVPAGSCSWSDVSVNKAVFLKGAGSGQTNITVNGSPSVTITKQTRIIRIEGFSFSSSNVSNPIVIQGSWLNTQPVIVEYNSFTMNNSGMFYLFVCGGVIFSHNSFTGDWGSNPFTVKDQANTNSWTTADSMGTHDTDGTKNIYIEDDTFYGSAYGIIDCDDNCRVVMRHNNISFGSFNSHGRSTSHYGMRHFEIYNNSFYDPDPDAPHDLGNISQFIWIRGGTGVVFDNYMDNISNSTWGEKPQVRLSIRGAEDVRPQGTCQQVSYPVPAQLGQNHNGTSYFTDPIYFWGNTGNWILPEIDDWNWGNPCGFTWSAFFQWGRDGINSALTGGTPKPGYTPFPYPHPLTQGAEIGLSPPTNLHAIP
jgi:hypothetical protein